MDERTMGAILGLISAAESNLAAARNLLAPRREPVEEPEVADLPSEDECAHPAGARKVIPSLGGGSTTICLKCSEIIEQPA